MIELILQLWRPKGGQSGRDLVHNCKINVICTNAGIESGRLKF
jgi:hypothetical protein